MITDRLQTKRFEIKYQICDRSAHVTGYLRQPLAIEPRPGMAVELRTRRPERRAATSVVEAVGGVLEPVPPTVLALFGRSGALEFRLRPGEQVDVMIDGTTGAALP